MGQWSHLSLLTTTTTTTTATAKTGMHSGRPAVGPIPHNVSPTSSSYSRQYSTSASRRHFLSFASVDYPKPLGHSPSLYSPYRPIRQNGTGFRETTMAFRTGFTTTTLWERAIKTMLRCVVCCDGEFGETVISVRHRVSSHDFNIAEAHTWEKMRSETWRMMQQCSTPLKNRRTTVMFP